MSMYLSNPDVRPTGAEPGEFIEPPFATEAGGATRSPTRRLDRQTRLNITRWASEYIAGLVAESNGDPEDVRSIIHGLHEQAVLAGDGQLWPRDDQSRPARSTFQ